MSKVKIFTDMDVRKLKPSNTKVEKNLGGGLYIILRPISRKNPQGRKSFYFRYLNGKQRTWQFLGDYPQLTLANAMQKVDENKKLVKSVGNLTIAKKIEEEKQELELKIIEESNFAVLMQKYIDFMVMSKKWGEKTRKAQVLRIEKYLLPCFAKKTINVIKIDDVNACFEQVVKLGSFEVGQKLARILVNVYEYADTLGILEDSNTIMLSRIKRLARALPRSPEKSRYQAFSELEIGELMTRLTKVAHCSLQVKIAIQLAPYLALRPHELCSLEWANVDLEKKVLVIPAEKMKMKREHLVPLSVQAVNLFKQLVAHKDRSNYVFYSKCRQYISTESLLRVLRKIGYNSTTHNQNTFCTHSFRGLFSTIAHQELKFPSDVIEFQLAHTEANKVKAAYNQLNTYSYLAERTELMQEYANYLERLKPQL